MSARSRNRSGHGSGWRSHGAAVARRAVVTVGLLVLSLLPASPAAAALSVGVSADSSLDQGSMYAYPEPIAWAWPSQGDTDAHSWSGSYFEGLTDGVVSASVANNQGWPTDESGVPVLFGCPTDQICAKVDASASGDASLPAGVLEVAATARTWIDRTDSGGVDVENDALARARMTDVIRVSEATTAVLRGRLTATVSAYSSHTPGWWEDPWAGLDAAIGVRVPGGEAWNWGPSFAREYAAMISHRNPVTGVIEADSCWRGECSTGGVFSSYVDVAAPLDIPFTVELSLPAGTTVLEGQLDADVDAGMYLDRDNGPTEPEAAITRATTDARLTFELVVPDGAQVTSLTGMFPIVTDGVPADLAPVARLAAVGASAEGSAVLLDASTSSDDHGIAAYDWDLDGDGAFDDASGASTTTTFADDGRFTVAVRVTDTAGATDVASQEIVVDNVAPTITTLTADATSPVGTTTLQVAFSDPGALDTHAVSVDWGDGSASDPLPVTESGGAGTATGTHTYAAPGSFTVEVSVVDDDGGSDRATQAVTVRPLDGCVDDLDCDGIPDAADPDALIAEVQRLAGLEPPVFEAPGHPAALIDRLQDLEAALQAGDHRGALKQLVNLLRRLDSCTAPTDTPAADDWTTDCAVQIALRDQLLALQAAIEAWIASAG